MMLGFAFGKIYEPGFEAQRRRKFLKITGCGLLGIFILLRMLDSYGDPTHWETQDRFINTIFSFVHVSKYPPSLLFTCLTIGPALLFLAFSEQVHSAFSRFIIVFGRVPFFYYILHIYLIHIMTVVLFYASGYGNSDIVSPNSFFNFRPANMGFDLWIVYLVWIGIICLLYLPCKWYNRYKSSQQHWWLHYL
jgi:uncharacterized membrane protein